MFAKLFDGISLRSQLNAAVFSALALTLLWFWSPASPSPDLSFSEKGWSLSLQRWSYFLLPWFWGLISAEALNRRHSQTGNYHQWVVLALLSLGFYPFLQALEPLLYSVVLFPFLLLATRLVGTQTSPVTFFNLGTGLALVSFWQPLSLVLGLILLLSSALLSGLRLRAIAAYALGASALYFSFFSFSWFFEGELGSHWLSRWSLLHWQVALPLSTFQLWYLPWLAVLLLLLFGFPLRLAKATSEERLRLSMPYLMLLAFLVAAILLSQKSYWLAAALWPFAWVSAQWLSSVSNPWLRDSIYLLLLLTPLALFLEHWRLLAFFF